MRRVAPSSPPRLAHARLSLSPPSPASICLVRLSALGDATLCLPMVRQLRRQLPEAKLTWVISPSAHALLSGLEGVEFLIVDKPRNPRDWLRTGLDLRRRHFDVLLAAQASARANLLYPWVKARRRIGFDPRRARDGHRWFVNEHIPRADEHLLDGFLAFAGQLGVSCSPLPTDYALPFDHRDAENVDALLAGLGLSGRPFAVLHPSASKPERNWSLDGYVSAARHLAAHHRLEVLVTGGPAETERALVSKIVASAGPGVRNLSGKTSPRLLACLLGRAKLLVAPDTGPVHFARASGTPVVGLYAVARSQLSGPHRQLDYTVDAWPDACRACGYDPLRKDWHWRAHALPGNQRAMDLIPVSLVLDAIDRCVDARSKAG